MSKICELSEDVGPGRSRGVRKSSHDGERTLVNQYLGLLQRQALGYELFGWVAVAGFSILALACPYLGNEY